MTLADWLAESRERIDREGVRSGVYASAQEFWAGALGRVGRRVWNYGESIHDREWDVLLVLDACRADLFAEVAADAGDDVVANYDPGRHVFDSVASRTPEWIEKTFDPDRYGDQLSDIAYVTANPHSRDLPDPTAFAYLDEVWEYGWDNDHGVVPPRTVTDRAIASMREYDPDRLIVHYMQPHVPFRSLQGGHTEWYQRRFEDRDANAAEKTLWMRLRDGELSQEVVWDAYRDNLEWVLGELDLLRNNLDADRAVLTSDHGNALGEWWLYGHQTPAPIPALKRVPWLPFEATDTGEYRPEFEAGEEVVDDAEYESRLRNLGYL